MGKASQAKKTARLARESGTTEPKRKRRLGFPLAIAGGIVVGVIVVLLARQPASTPQLTIDPTAITVDPNTVTTDSAPVVPGGVDAVPTTVLAGQ